MRSSKVTPLEDQRRFWRVVRKCLEQFFPENRRELLDKVRCLRKEVESWPINEIELFFHSEPIHVVNQLADQPLDIEQVLETYVRIRDDEEAN